MRLLLDLGEGVLERSDDGSGMLGEVFRQTGAELGRLWALLPVRDCVFRRKPAGDSDAFQPVIPTEASQ